MGKFIDITGRRFGRLVAIRRAPIDSGPRKGWYCICDCGSTTEKPIPSGNLRYGSTSSCGCLKTESSFCEAGEVAINRMFTMYKSDAKRRWRKHPAMTFSLTKSEFFDIACQNCYYCFAPPRRVNPYLRSDGTPKTRRKVIASSTIERAWAVANGIDRFDNNIGYTLENCLPCCTTCNFMKGTMTFQEFVTHIDRIHEGFNRRQKEAV